jgi:hypothetical protein
MFDDVLTVEHFLDYLVVWPLCLEKLIVHLTSSGWIDPDEVTSTLVFGCCLSYVLLIPQASRLLQRFEQARILYWVLVNMLVDGRLELSCRLASKNLGTWQANQTASC